MNNMYDNFKKAKEIIEVIIPNINREINGLINSKKLLLEITDSYLESPSKLGVTKDNFREMFKLGLEEKEIQLINQRFLFEEELKQYLKWL